MEEEGPEDLLETDRTSEQPDQIKHGQSNLK